MIETRKQILVQNSQDPHVFKEKKNLQDNEKRPLQAMLLYVCVPQSKSEWRWDVCWKGQAWCMKGHYLRWGQMIVPYPQWDTLNHAWHIGVCVTVPCL